MNIGCTFVDPNQINGDSLQKGHKPYTVQLSVVTTYYTASGHSSWHRANVGFTRNSGLPLRCLCRFHSSEIRLCADRLELTKLSRTLAAFLRYTSKATEQPMYV
jgi:hypothetical protein